jgi:hypothetical protein
MDLITLGISVQLVQQEAYKKQISKKSEVLFALSGNPAGFFSNITYVDPKENSTDPLLLFSIIKSNNEKLSQAIEEADKEIQQARLKTYFPLAKKELQEEMTWFAAINRIQNAFVRGIARIAYLFGGRIIDAFLDRKGGRVVLEPEIKKRAETILQKVKLTEAAEAAKAEAELCVEEEAKIAMSKAAKEAAKEAAKKIEKEAAKKAKKARNQRLEATQLRMQAAKTARQNAYGR